MKCTEKVFNNTVNKQHAKRWLSNPVNLNINSYKILQCTQPRVMKSQPFSQLTSMHKRTSKRVKISSHTQRHVTEQQNGQVMAKDSSRLSFILSVKNNVKVVIASTTKSWAISIDELHSLDLMITHTLGMDKTDLKHSKAATNMIHEYSWAPSYHINRRLRYIQAKRL